MLFPNLIPVLEIPKKIPSNSKWDCLQSHMILGFSADAWCPMKLS